MYLASTYVKAFPLGRPRATASNDITSRIFYEQCVSNIIRQLIDVDGYIISGCEITNESGKLSSNLELNIAGYYYNIQSNASIFNLDSNGALTNSSGKVLSNTTAYVYFCIDLTTTEPYEIIGQDDDDGNYQGLVIEMSDVPPEEYNEHTYRVPVFRGRTDASGKPQLETWEIYNNSYIKFDIESLNITGIDGKH